MNLLRVSCICGALAAIGCGGDESSTGPKAEVDVSMLEDGDVAAAVTEEVGSIAMTFADPIPDVDDEALEMEMLDAATVVVSDSTNGTTADLADGTLVHGEPSAPGEYSWALDESRTELTMSFYNRTASGMTIEPGTVYRVTMSIAENAYISEMPATSFEVTFEATND